MQIMIFTGILQTMVTEVGLGLDAARWATLHTWQSTKRCEKEEIMKENLFMRIDLLY